MSCDTLKEQTTSDPNAGAQSAWRYVFSALVAGSVCVLIIEPDLLFCCLVIPLYLLLFVLHAYWVRSYLVNVIVVLVFYFAPVSLEILRRYFRLGDWGDAFSHLRLEYIIWQFAVPAVHVLYQTGMVFLFRMKRKTTPTDAVDDYLIEDLCDEL
ncbi:MAG: hypothetical protein IH624_08545 [Phycisphaerae bacterium]|nr:hypothetical protein [Phycisphaerae bacterium]